VKSKKTTIPENDAISTKIGAVTCLLVRRLSTPKGVRVRGRDGYKLKGKTTGRAFRCRLEGCPGYRIVIKWECPHCRMDNTKGRVRGKLFQMYCTERSRGTGKEEAKRIAIEVVARLDVETT
jgi:hypothetical protein